MADKQKDNQRMTITVPSRLLDELDKLSKIRGQSRSQTAVDAIREFVVTHKDDSF